MIKYWPFFPPGQKTNILPPLRPREEFNLDSLVTCKLEVNSYYRVGNLLQQM